MAAPLVEVSGSAGSGPLPQELVSALKPDDLERLVQALPAGPTRRLAIYPRSAGFGLLDELDHLGARAIEPNVFFSPRFLAPAMPRLDDRDIRLAVIRDETRERSRLRLLVPFTVENLPVPVAVPVMRTWSNPFGPLGTPLVDHDDPVGVLEDFFRMLAQPSLKLPKVFVFPDTRTDGPFAAALHAVAEARSLPLIVSGQVERPYLRSGLDGDSYLRKNLKPHHFRELRRQKRKLEGLGRLEYKIARNPDDVAEGVEAFLSLEVAGWKGRAGTAMRVDRMHAAFAREATQLLAQRDQCRVHMLTLDGRPIAVLIVLIASGVAYTWKTAFDETLAHHSPGTLLLAEMTRNHLEDPNITESDSCAEANHPVMSRLWSERYTIGTFVVGLTPDSDRAARQAETQLALYRHTRTRVKGIGRWLRRLLGK